jgi:XTP/dITP diphosphohydrolase
MNESPPLLVATHNEGKVREIAGLLSDLPLVVRWLSEFPHIPEAEETGATFLENAVLKARHYSSLSGLLTLSDDSGLEVDALSGAPGVHSARYGGRELPYPQKMARLLEELAGAGGGENRHARFTCVIALADPLTGEVNTFEGVCEGRLAREPAGSGGFGYDPLFVPEGHAQTFGELPPEVKKALSHRARALARASAFLRARFS